MPVHHVKGQPTASTYVREKGVLLLTLIVYTLYKFTLPSIRIVAYCQVMVLVERLNSGLGHYSLSYQTFFLSYLKLLWAFPYK